jgi:RHS repeat-associated protein/uncharacterized protein (TIGR03000 family)
MVVTSFAEDYTMTVKNALGRTETRDYSYNATDELLGDGVGTFDYDLAGNRNTTGYVTGPKNQYLSDGVFNYFYDGEGNLDHKVRVSDGERTTFTYDHNNQLTNVEKASASGPIDLAVEFKYDVFGNRIEEIADLDGAGSGSAVTTRFAYDGLHVWADLDGGSSLTTRRIFGDQVDQVLARITGSTVSWYLTDRLGSVREIANNTTGAFIDEIAYGGFGNVESETTPANGDRYKFTGREFFVEIGLYDYRARTYDAGIGRFYQEDPIFVSADVNPYRYAENGPTNATDPMGLAPVVPPTLSTIGPGQNSPLGETKPAPSPDAGAGASRPSSGNIPGGVAKPQPADQPANLRILVAPNARVELNSQASQQTGGEHKFTTPALPAFKKSLYYTVKATWKDSTGKEWVREKVAFVQAGETTTVDLRPEGSFVSGSPSPYAGGAYLDKLRPGTPVAPPKKDTSSAGQAKTNPGRYVSQLKIREGERDIRVFYEVEDGRAYLLERRDDGSWQRALGTIEDLVAQKRADIAFEKDPSTGELVPLPSVPRRLYVQPTTFLLLPGNVEVTEGEGSSEILYVPIPINEMSDREKIIEALRRTPNFAEGEARRHLAEAFSPTNLKIIAGFLLAAKSAPQAAAILGTILGPFLFGKEMADLGQKLVEATVQAVNAKNDKEINGASRKITKVLVVAVTTGVAAWATHKMMPGGSAPTTNPWANMTGRTFRRWLESLETQAAQTAGAGRLTAAQTRTLLAELRQQGWNIPRGVETQWVGGAHINIIGPGGGPNIHLPVPPGFVP